MRLFIGRVISWFGKHELLNFIDDKLYLKIIYYFFMGKKLDLDKPLTLNEKIQWLKIYDRKKIYPELVDKYIVKKHIVKWIGAQYVIPTIGIWSNFDNIDFTNLPNKFVLKCTHDSGSCIVCNDKNYFDYKKARTQLSKKLSRNYFWLGREWAYKNTKPQIIAEPYLEEGIGKDLTDYKFYCFNGRVDCVLLCFGRETGNTQFYFFDRDWKFKRYNKLGKNAPKDFTLSKPDNINEMFNIAGILATKSEASFVRVDLYNVNGKIYFGELTLYPNCGLDRNRLPETDLYFGGLLKLPLKNTM